MMIETEPQVTFTKGIAKMKKYIILQDGQFLELTKELKDQIAIVLSPDTNMDNIKEGVLLGDLIESWNRDTNESW